MIWDTLEQRQRDVLHLDVDALWLKPPDHRLKVPCVDGFSVVSGCERPRGPLRLLHGTNLRWVLMGDFMGNSSINGGYK